VARLVSGITGRAAGTCAGVQLYKARRGPGRVTAVRASPEITAPRSPAQLMYQERMSEVRRFPTTVNPYWPGYIIQGNTAPFGWFADFFALLAPQISPGAAFTTLKDTGYRSSRFGYITKATITLTRVSTTSLRLTWTSSPLYGNQLATDYIHFALFRTSLPWSRTAANFRYHNGALRRTNAYYTLTGLTSGAAFCAIVWFDRGSGSTYRREPMQLITISS